MYVQSCNCFSNNISLKAGGLTSYEKKLASMPVVRKEAKRLRIPLNEYVKGLAKSQKMIDNLAKNK